MAACLRAKNDGKAPSIFQDQLNDLGNSEYRRLACVLGGPVAPSLLIMDEPTNHLDVDSIETVEAGLRAYDGALLVVSHDEAFLDAIGISRKVVLSVMA